MKDVRLPTIGSMLVDFCIIDLRFLFFLFILIVHLSFKDVVGYASLFIDYAHGAQIPKFCRLSPANNQSNIKSELEGRTDLGHG
jgi:hypothetical protein